MKKELPDTYSESLFIDSGAHSLYFKHVAKVDPKDRDPKSWVNGKLAWGHGDFSFFDLTAGSEFRKYADGYAKFIKAMKAKDPTMLFANIDVISNPQKSWEVQEYFEKEHGLYPVPVIHCHTDMKWVEHYLEREENFPLLGIGGIAQQISKQEYFGWGDKLFTVLCPKSNDYLPLRRTHGFAMTSVELMFRYPWWSVDSTSWVKYSAYGWVALPRSNAKGEFLLDQTPITVNFSRRSGKWSYPKHGAIHTADNAEAPSPRAMERAKHYDNLPGAHKEMVVRWLTHIGIDLKAVDDNRDNTEMDLTNHHRMRSIANLIYFNELQSAIPAYPWPLSLAVRKAQTATRPTLGL